MCQKGLSTGRLAVHQHRLSVLAEGHGADAAQVGLGVVDLGHEFAGGHLPHANLVHGVARTAAFAADRGGEAPVWAGWKPR